MLWKEIKSWSKKHGYESSKNEDSYSWLKISEPEKNGCEKSVSKLATAIFNDMTDNIWVEYQNTYDKEVLNEHRVKDKKSRC